MKYYNVVIFSLLLSLFNNTIFAQTKIGVSAGIGLRHYNEYVNFPGFKSSLLTGLIIRHYINDNSSIIINSFYEFGNYPNKCCCAECDFKKIEFRAINTSLLFNFIKLKKIDFGTGLNFNYLFNFKTISLDNQPKKQIKYRNTFSIFGLDFSSTYNYKDFSVMLKYTLSLKEITKSDGRKEFSYFPTGSNHYLSATINYLFKFK